MPLNSHKLLETIIDKLNAGVIVVNSQFQIVLWNEFLANHSDIPPVQVVGRDLFEAFPDLPREWLEPKIRNVFILRNYAFTSWDTRPYLLPFNHNRPVSGGVDCMRQNCTFIPLQDPDSGEEFVCITLYDVTDSSIYETLLKDAVKNLSEMSSRDALTNIYNRRFLIQTLEKDIGRSVRYGHKLSIILFDLDHFKRVNDNFGHLMGDQVLKTVAELASSSLRSSDTIGRYGGEEFIIILPETSLEGALVLAERLRVKIASTPIFHKCKKLRITASMGVAQLAPDCDKVEPFIHNADIALYHSKANRRNEVTAYLPGLPDLVGKQFESSVSEDEDWEIFSVTVGYR
ncbi:MAG: GGDEF domain-containing protein [Gammaproteobacteria bacterium]|nr:GGDEF domain-containing protein [Gammaproteobacteria bacterium]